MATPQAVAETVLTLAQHFLESQREALAALAVEDKETLLRAQQLVRATKQGLPERERTREHIAFALLTTAYWESYPAL